MTVELVSISSKAHTMRSVIISRRLIRFKGVFDCLGGIVFLRYTF